jgi:transcriptional regulator with XRE-family HTH domain
MFIREKIKLLRQSRKWSQEYLAEKLGMSANGYGEIERGNSRMTFEKIEELSQLFEVPLGELCDDEKTNVFIAHNNHNATQAQHNQQSCHTSCSKSEYIEIKHELEKQQLLNAEKDKEIALLKRIIELMETKNTESL